MPAKKYFSSSIPMLKLVQFKFNSTVNFVKNNKIITTSCIQKFSTRVTMNKLLTNNGLKLTFEKETALHKNKSVNKKNK